MPLLARPAGAGDQPSARLVPAEGGLEAGRSGPRDRREARAAWTYPTPVAAFAGLRDTVAVFPARMDHCTVDGERVRPQDGGCYGGWVTDDVVGPFTGAPGTLGW